MHARRDEAATGPRALQEAQTGRDGGKLAVDV